MPQIGYSILDSWFEYFLENTKKLPTGITKRRLLKEKEDLFKDRGFWFQVLHRFSAGEKTPGDYFDWLKANGVNPQSAFNQIEGNFWGQIVEKYRK